MVDSVFLYYMVDSVFLYNMVDSVFLYYVVDSVFLYYMVGSVFLYYMVGSVFLYYVVDSVFLYCFVCQTTSLIFSTESSIILQCIPQRSALIKSILNFFRKIIPDSTFADDARQRKHFVLCENVSIVCCVRMLALCVV